MAVRKVSSIESKYEFVKEMLGLIDQSTHDAAKPLAKQIVQEMEPASLIAEIRELERLDPVLENNTEVYNMIRDAVSSAGFIYRRKSVYEESIREFMCSTVFSPWNYRDTEEYEARKVFSFFGFIRVHRDALQILNDQELELLSLWNEWITVREWAQHNGMTEVKAMQMSLNAHNKAKG